jgi:hypothetical protein
MKEVVDGEQGRALGKSYDVDIYLQKCFQDVWRILDVLDIILVVGGFSKFVTCFHCLIARPCTQLISLPSLLIRKFLVVTNLYAHFGCKNPLNAIHLEERLNSSMVHIGTNIKGKCQDFFIHNLDPFYISYKLS